MTNYALAQQIVKQDYDKAEKLYHMALTIDKNDRSAHTNLDELLLNRLPGGLYVSPRRAGGPARPRVTRRVPRGARDTAQVRRRRPVPGGQGPLGPLRQGAR